MVEFFTELPHAVQALIATIFTWAITALGASFVFFFKRINRNIMDAMLGFSAGVMIAASFWSLLSPAIEQAMNLGLSAGFVSLCGFMAGGALLFTGDKIYLYFNKHISAFCCNRQIKEKHQKTKEDCMRFKRCCLLIFSITLHNIPEGLAVGVAFGSIAYGLDGATLPAACLLALGIGLQNFPEGTAVSVPLRREGFSRKKSFFYGQLSGIVEPIAGVAGSLLVLRMRYLLPYLLSFAAGAMIYVVVEELIPESQSNKRKDFMALFTLIGFSVMMVLDVTLS